MYPLISYCAAKYKTINAQGSINQPNFDNRHSMKEKVLVISILLLNAYISFAQLGIGTKTPNLSAQLDVVSSDKGVLIPRVELKDTHLMEPIINSGSLPNGLLVFNTATSAPHIVPGYYYWYMDRWYPLVNDSSKQSSGNVVYDGTIFKYYDHNGDLQEIDFKKLVSSNESLTILFQDPTTGALTYTDEAGDTVKANVISSNANNLVQAGTDGGAYVDGKTIKLNQTITSLVQDPTTGGLTYTNEAGDAVKANVLSSDADNLVQTGTDGGAYLNGERIRENETETILDFDSSSGKLTYKNERDNNPVIDLLPLAIEPWYALGTTEKATLNTEDIFTMGRVSIGSSIISDSQVTLFVNGKIATSNGTVISDYVFEKYYDGFSELNPAYKFQSLEKVEEFIKTNKHLPGVVGIKDLDKTENGNLIINMSDLTMQILEKVEELFLYTLEQQKLIDEKITEIAKLEGAMEAMESRLRILENNNKN